MIMELPKKRNVKISYAQIKNGNLIIFDLCRYEDMIFELTYATKKKVCAYCGKRLKQDNRTLDHIYPRSTGGVSIINNLNPSCPKCNSKKDNLTDEEYFEFIKKKKSKNEQKEFLRYCSKRKEQKLKSIGYDLPNSWVMYEKVEKIKYIKPKYEYIGKKYYKIVEFYKKYKHLPRPVIIDKNNELLDGYNLLMFARKRKIKKVPVIRLDNVVLY